MLNAISERITNHGTFDLDKDRASNILGVKWNCIEDVFQYSSKIQPQLAHTKRAILSNIAKIFDPLGLLAPILTTVKVIMQKLWKCEAKWDEQLPDNIVAEWIRYAASLVNLESFKIQSKVIDFVSGMQIQLHGFYDASEQAYGACIYVRTYHQGIV